MKRFAFWLLVLLCVSSFAAMAYLVFQHLSLKGRITSQAKGHLQDLTRSAAARIDGTLREVMTAAELVADDLSSGRLPKDEELMKRRMAETLGGNRHFFAISITFKPHAYRADRRLFSPYYKRGAAGLIYQPVETRYDYTGYDWYAAALKQGRSTWVEPYFGLVGGTLMTSYSALFYGEDPVTRRKVPAGVVVIDLSVDELRKIAESLELGPSGFGALISRKGVYLYHPNNEYVVERKTIMDVARERSDRDRLALGERLMKGEAKGGIIDHESTTTGLSSWLAFESIPATGWCLLNTFIKSDVPFDVDTLRRQLMGITCLAMLFLLSLSALLLDLHGGETRRLWTASAVASGVLIGGIGAVWYLALTYESPRKERSVAILDRATLGKLQHDYAGRSLQRHTAPPVYLPTGMFIDSVRLTGDNAAMMTGYIWQKYDTSVPRDLSRAISIPMAEDVRLSEPHIMQDNGAEVLRWQFQARVRERMSYARYPLDQEILTLQLLHRDINHNVVLVPDIPGYKLMNPTSLPGLEKGVAIPGWTIERTFFDLVEKGYDTDFGITQSVLRENFPLLRYNIVVKRNFIDAFISNLTPLIVVAIMLFLLLLTATGDDKTVEKMKTGAGHALSMSSALFFVVIFSHIGIRQRIQAQDIFYLEYFYFVIYAAILCVAVLSILFALAKNLTFVQYRDNLISKLTYWPGILSVLFAITLYVFY